MKKFNSLMLAVIGLLCSINASAHDFEVDGIYYNITSSTDKMVEVTYRGGDYNSYTNEYSGVVIIPESVTYNGSIYSVTSIGSSAFYYCDGLTSVVIPNSVTSIGEYAFSDCYALTSVEIGNSVTDIGMYAFDSCLSLTSVVIPNSVTSIGGGAFARCSGLTSVVIPNSVTSIGSSTFEGCSGLTSVEIPNSVTSIGDWAFYGCSGLTSVEIPNSVTSIGSAAFSWCSGFTSVVIPNSVTSIGDGALAGCSGLLSIVVDDENSYYDSREGCNAIIEKLSNTLILGCQSTIIPNSVTSIGSSAFSGCSGLTSVEIPNSVTSIGFAAFYDCSSLTSVTSYIPANKLFPIDSDTFYFADTDQCTLYVPKGAKETYATMEGWNVFENIVEIHPGYELTVTDAGYSTLYLDFTAEIPEGVEVYTAKEVDGVWLQMEQVEEVLPANTGVVVKAPAGTYKFAYSNTTAPSIENNLFKGSETDKYINVPSNSSAFVLSKVDGEVGMYLAKLTDGSFLNNANKAYLLIDNNKLGLSDDELDTSVDGAQLSLRFNFGGATGVDKVQTESGADAVIYDLYGRKVQQIMRPGLYIINGKKVMMK